MSAGRAERGHGIIITIARDSGQKKRQFVRKVWIEDLVLKYAISLVHNEELLDFITENTYQYYLEQNTDSAYTDSLRENLGLKKEHILFFLHRFAEMDYTNEACQKHLIKTVINSVFVYDTKVVITFNYSGDNRTITLNEIDAGLQHGVQLPRALAYQVALAKEM